MKQPINEKLSTVATIAIAALINQKISVLKKQVQTLSKNASVADKSTSKSEKDLSSMEKSIKDLTTQVKTLSTAAGPTSNKKEESDRIRKLIRIEVGRILFDIYKLRNTWKTV